MNIIEILSGDVIEAVLNLVELGSLALMVRANIKLNKILGEEKTPKINKSIVYNTLAFDPDLGEEFPATLKPAPLRGAIFIDPKEGVTNGEDIVALIKGLQDRYFLVSKPVFDFLTKEGVKNVAVFDAAKTIYNDGKAVAQNGLIYGDEI